jgi:hypothetical protein
VATRDHGPRGTGALEVGGQREKLLGADLVAHGQPDEVRAARRGPHRGRVGGGVESGDAGLVPGGAQGRRQVAQGEVFFQIRTDEQYAHVSS